MVLNIFSAFELNIAYGEEAELLCTGYDSIYYFQDGRARVSKGDKYGFIWKTSPIAHSGSNYWPDSNIRTWLNSSDEKVKWIKCPLNDVINPYADEKGLCME